jgi:hypothetical protein
VVPSTMMNDNAIRTLTHVSCRSPSATRGITSCSIVSRDDVDVARSMMKVKPGRRGWEIKGGIS